jgi:hypothetical protein
LDAIKNGGYSSSWERLIVFNWHLETLYELFSKYNFYLSIFSLRASCITIFFVLHRKLYRSHSENAYLYILYNIPYLLYNANGLIIYAFNLPARHEEDKLLLIYHPIFIQIWPISPWAISISPTNFRINTFDVFLSYCAGQTHTYMHAHTNADENITVVISRNFTKNKNSNSRSTRIHFTTIFIRSAVY